MTPKQWFAVYTRPRSEKKVATTMASKGVDIYCPIQKVRKKWHDRVKVIDEPIFRSYVFVHITESERIAVLSDFNVLAFVHHCGKPAVIKETEIDTIRKFLGEHMGCKLSVSTATENDVVRIEEGLFIDYKGVIVKKSKHKASIRLELFNAYIVAEFTDEQFSVVQ